jgi:hypothetical protein
MRTIWKYPLHLDDMQRVRFRKDAKILSVQIQGEDLCLWVMVDSDAKEEWRTIAIFGTGHEIPKDLNLLHIGTVQHYDGKLVWHVFEVLSFQIKNMDGKIRT